MQLVVKCPNCSEEVYTSEEIAYCPFCQKTFEVNLVEVAKVYVPAEPSEGYNGCLIWIGLVLVLFALSKTLGGGGIFGALLGVVLALGIPVGIGIVVIWLMTEFGD